MSVDICKGCDRHIDTDYNVECYREEFDDELLCDVCYEAKCSDPDLMSEELRKCRSEIKELKTLVNNYRYFVDNSKEPT